MNRKLAFLALGIFVTVATMIVLVQAFGLGYGLLPDMTISRYVGLGYWSAGTFLVANIVMALIQMKYALGVADEWEMGKLWKVISLVAAVMLVMLSACPMGLYDSVPGELGVVSRLHRFSSYAMFVLMLLSDLGLLLRIKAKWFRICGALYLVFGLALAVLAVINNDWFWGNTLVLESLFLVGYLIILCIVPRREKKDTKAPLDVI